MRLRPLGTGSHTWVQSVIFLIPWPPKRCTGKPMILGGSLQWSQREWVRQTCLLKPPMESTPQVFLGGKLGRLIPGEEGQ